MSKNRSFSNVSHSFKVKMKLLIWSWAFDFDSLRLPPLAFPGTAETFDSITKKDPFLLHVICLYVTFTWKSRLVQCWKLLDKIVFEWTEIWKKNWSWSRSFVLFFFDSTRLKVLRNWIFRVPLEQEAMPWWGAVKLQGWSWAITEAPEFSWSRAGAAEKLIGSETLD